jgi:hypothetical protein
MVTECHTAKQAMKTDTWKLFFVPSVAARTTGGRFVSHRASFYELIQQFPNRAVRNRISSWMIDVKFTCYLSVGAAITPTQQNVFIRSYNPEDII